MTAKLLKDVSSAFQGEAKVFRLSPPMDGHEVVVASAVNAFFSGPETYFFPSTEEGTVTDWGELSGSQRGTLNITKVLSEAGYTIE